MGVGVAGCKAEARNRGLKDGKRADAVDSDGHEALVGGGDGSRQQQAAAEQQTGKRGRGNECNNSESGVGQLPRNPKDGNFVDDIAKAVLDGIWVESERLGIDYRPCWHKAVEQLTPLISKRKKSSRGLQCISMWKRVLQHLRDSERG